MISRSDAIARSFQIGLMDARNNLQAVLGVRSGVCCIGRVSASFCGASIIGRPVAQHGDFEVDAKRGPSERFAMS